MTFSKIVLSNGLLVLLKEIRTAPLISQWLWYRVGSRYEVPGITGISHWVEHMMFKGTDSFPANQLDKTISRTGGSWNARTSMDWTVYYENMPADQIELTLKLEADRMRNSIFDPKEVSAERTVIISERQGRENNPLFLLREKLQATAFHVHPYRHMVIGDLVDLQAIQRDQLFNFYRTYYVPNNAILCLAGDFGTQDMLAQISAYYEDIPGGDVPSRQKRKEPEQKKQRRALVEGPGKTTFIQIGYRTPQANHPDFFPMLVLSSILTGPTNLNRFGAGLSNKTSRLHRALIDTELAVGIGGSLTSTIDPFLYMITLTLHPQQQSAKSLVALEGEIKRIQDNPPPEEEVTRALKQARALFAYGSESIPNQAFWLGYAEIFADYSWFLTYLDNLTQVTPADVQRIAQMYLRPQNRTLGIYQPHKV
jgi:zinc protease